MGLNDLSPPGTTKGWVRSSIHRVRSPQSLPGMCWGLGSWYLLLRDYHCCYCVPSYLTVRKQEIIKVTEQLIEAISNGDFESYT